MALVSNEGASDHPKDRALAEYRRKLMEHREIEARLKEGKCSPFYVCLVII